MKKSKPIITEFLREMYNNTQGMDAVITSMILYGAYDGAEKQQIPCINTLLVPAVPTNEFPMVATPHIPRALNKISHKCLEQGFWLCFKRQNNRMRKEEWNLPKLSSCPIDILRKKNAPTLLGYSEAIVPKPKDWGENEIVTGYWQRRVSAEFTPDARLVEFLECGNRPIYIGFGSMPIGNADNLVNMIKEALYICDERAVVFLSYNTIKDQRLDLKGISDPRIYITDSVPHSWLFPRVRAAVIHGGAGTCAASLKAGIPTIIIPFMGDQAFWGEQVHKIGAGPKPVLYKKLTSAKLAELITKTTTNNKIAERAKYIGSLLQKENGSDFAANKIHNYLRQS